MEKTLTREKTKTDTLEVAEPKKKGNMAALGMGMAALAFGAATIAVTTPIPREEIPEPTQPLKICTEEGRQLLRAHIKNCLIRFDWAKYICDVNVISLDNFYEVSFTYAGQSRVARTFVPVELDLKSAADQEAIDKIILETAQTIPKCEPFLNLNQLEEFHKLVQDMLLWHGLDNTYVKESTYLYTTDRYYFDVWERGANTTRICQVEIKRDDEPNDKFVEKHYSLIADRAKQRINQKERLVGIDGIKLWLAKQKELREQPPQPEEELTSNQITLLVQRINRFIEVLWQSNYSLSLTGLIPSVVSLKPGHSTRTYTVTLNAPTWSPAVPKSFVIYLTQASFRPDGELTEETMQILYGRIANIMNDLDRATRADKIIKRVLEKPVPKDIVKPIPIDPSLSPVVWNNILDGTYLTYSSSTKA